MLLELCSTALFALVFGLAALALDLPLPEIVFVVYFGIIFVVVTLGFLIVLFDFLKRW